MVKKTGEQEEKLSAAAAYWVFSRSAQPLQ